MAKQEVVKVRKSETRGHTKNAWLDTFHTFSVEKYYNPDYVEFGSLRVLNEDKIKPGRGFGTHPHENFEIYTYVISGELEHKDSMGNVETIKRGGVQFTSAGSGIMHSEHNRGSETVHLLQIWVTPDQQNLKPSYSTMEFSDEQKKNQLCLLVSPISKQPKKQKQRKTPAATTTMSIEEEQQKLSPEKEEEAGNKTIGIHQDAYTFASILDKEASVIYLVRKDRKVHIHLIMTSKKASITIRAAYNSGKCVEEQVLSAGDGAFIVPPKNQDVSLVIEGGKEATTEFLLFDVKK